MDVRQVMGAVLTFSMFMMLGNMIKRDHFDGDVLVDVPATSDVEQDFYKLSRHSLFQVANQVSKDRGQQLKLCWSNSLLLKGKERSKGFVTFSLTNGPEYHISQVANAVLIAKHLGATLVLPDIIGSKGEKRSFEEIYDADKFIASMTGIIQVEKRNHPEASSQKAVSVRVPYNANRNYITTNVEPLFQTTRNLRVITYFPSLTATQGKVDKDMNPISCWVTFEALRLRPKLQEVVDAIVGELKRHDQNEFIAIDYNSEMLGTSVCRGKDNNGMKSCYNMTEITRFLQRIGYPKDTIVYVTQPRLDRSLNVLKDTYLNTFTKGDVMQAQKRKFFDAESSELEQKIIDFYLCSVSDVFIPSVSSLFYKNVVGNRIAASNTQVLVPAQITSTLAQDHMSAYISKRTHPAFACFCQ